ncbi:permease, partial [mine drainage metagenome]
SSIYWYNGFIQFYLAAATAIGVLIGAIIGSKILLKISNKDVRWVFFAILSFLGVDMALKGIDKSKFIILASIYQFYIAISISIILIVSLYVIFRIGEKKIG